MRKALLLLSISIASTWSAPSLQAADSGDVRDVSVIDTLDPNGPYNKIWEPHFTKWTGRQFVVCYGLQVRGKGDMGDIVCSVTRDAGRTWEPRTFVFDHRQRNGTVQYAYNNPVVFRPDGSDVIWLFVMRAPLHYRDSENADLVAAYTADGGRSWHHVELAMDYQAPLIIVAGIQTVMRDGVPHYLLPAHRNTRRRDKHGDRRQFVLESASLLHWKLGGYVEYPADNPVFLHEGKIAPNDEGEGLKIVMRTADMQREKPLDPPLAWSSVSRDGGRTWSEARPEPQLPNHRAKSFYGRNSDGTHIYVYNDSYERNGLFYKTRKPGGGWSKERPFYHQNNKNSYPTLIEDKPGQWIAVWDSSDSPDKKRTAIRFGRLKVRF
jgi:hypothetical protein